MRTYFFLLIFLWWLLLLLTFVPALMIGLLCAWRMAGLTWRKGLVAGLAGGFVGVACSMAWYWFTYLIPESDVVAIVGFFHAAHPQRHQRLGHLPPLEASDERIAFLTSIDPGFTRFGSGPAVGPWHLSTASHVSLGTRTTDPKLGEDEASCAQALVHG